MHARKPKVIVTRKLPDPVETRMRELFDAELNVTDAPMGREALLDAIGRAEVLAPTITDRIDAELIAAAGDQLKLIANYGAGVDHIDIAAATERGITVTNTPGVLTEDTADLTMALVLAVSRRSMEGESMLRAGKFVGWAPTLMLGRSLTGKQLGIVGMGRIGQAVARRARAFGMHIHYHNRKPVSPRLAEELDATYWENLDQMLARVDIVSLHSPYTPATHNLLSARRLKLLQPHAFVINTARGDLLDEEALADLLNEGAIAGAGLDVYRNEPNVNQKLLNAPNIVLLPHLGSATMEARTAMGEKVIVNIKTWMDGHRPPDRVLPQML